MATDAAKHTVPAGTDGMRRQNLLDLSLSIHDIIPVANATERDTVYAALVAAGRAPAAAPVIVDRLDTGVLERNDGSGWVQSTTDMGAWTTFTPGLTNATVGNGMIQGFFKSFGSTGFIEAHFTLGSTSALSVSALFMSNLPFNSSPIAGVLCGQGLAFDASAGVRVPLFCTASGTAVQLWRSSDGTAITSTIPFAWATGNRIDVQLVTRGA